MYRLHFSSRYPPHVYSESTYRIEQRSPDSWPMFEPTHLADLVDKL